MLTFETNCPKVKKAIYSVYAEICYDTYFKNCSNITKFPKTIKNYFRC